VKDTYDYIIVGAGSAGSAVAYGLSADPANSVLLIEGGRPDDSPFIRMPRGLGVIGAPGSKYVWEYEVQTGGNGPSERWISGGTLGGGSSVNGMIYMRGAPIDYDGWAALGCDGWSWEEVSRAFVKLENHDQGAGPTRGVGGPLRISTYPQGNPLYEAILNAGAEMGIPRVADVNDVHAVREGGLGYQPSTTWRNQRFSAARAFLEPARQRPNLDIVTGVFARKVLFEGTRAAAVEVADKDGVRSIKAKHEIVLSAGAVRTPKLLQLSGVGPAALLKSHGIDVVVDAPDVGQNLREHRHVDLRLEVRGESQNGILGGPGIFWALLQYFAGRTGPMTHPAHEIGGFAKSEPGLDHADIQFGLFSLTASMDETGKIGLDKFPGITFVTYFTRPESQGSVTIQSADPNMAPLVNANHLSAEIDRKKFVATARWNRRLAAQPALKPWVVEESRQTAPWQTDEEILANAMAMSGTCFHIAGTARMGVDPRAVLDPRLRVRGVSGLRVADTSVMPTLVSGNTNGPAMMVGTRAAEFIAADRAAGR
jgi:choline dehydrogenase-like flavoprotein